jgi:hypothetical protein
MLPAHSTASGYAANGNVKSVWDMYNGNSAYGYDTLNRLTGLAGPARVIYGTNYTRQCWTYDSLGNRKSEIDQNVGCPKEPLRRCPISR